AEVRPRAGFGEQGAGVALDPQGEQPAVGWISQPRPDLAPGRCEAAGCFSAVAQRFEVAQLVLARTGQQSADQLILGPEQEQQDAWARPDRLGERTQRHVGQPVAEHVLIGGLEQFLLPGGGRLRDGHRGVRSSSYTWPMRSAPKLRWRSSSTSVNPRDR